jgi:mannose-6-phosphate isomerase-like protein (cupin superfamily)
MTLLLHTAIVAALGLAMQSAPPAQTRPRPRPRSTSTRIGVHDQSGAPVPGARVVVSGAASNEATTDANGAASLASMRDGSYRLRFEREGFITLERDVTVRTGQPAEIDVVLDAAPPPPSPPPHEPAPTLQAGMSGPPVTVSIPAFLDKNFIGRDPLKESVFGCTGDSTTRVLQIRDALAPHAHADLDEVIYVVAGDGTVRVGAQSTPIAPGSLSVIPRGVSHALERRGKNPLIVLSMLAGAPCQSGLGAAGR